ncbi:MAG: hypothetical protein ACREKL_14760 [Chthoniobacterales bacterium]
MSAMHDQLTALLAREPFVPFALETADGRCIEIRRRDQAVLNSLAISVVEEAFSVTVLGLEQIKGIAD